MIRLFTILSIIVVTALTSLHSRELEYFTTKIYQDNLKHTVKVHISCVDRCGSGSGTIIKSKKLPGRFFVLSNGHVLGDKEGKKRTKVFVEFSDRKMLRASVKFITGWANARDIGVAELIFEPSDKKYLDKHSLEVSSENIVNNDPKVGEMAYFIGSPAGIYGVMKSGLIAKPSEFVFYKGKFVEVGYFINTGVIGGSSGSVIYDSDNKIIGMICCSIGTSGALSVSVKPFYIKEILSLLRII